MITYAYRAYANQLPRFTSTGTGTKNTGPLAKAGTFLINYSNRLEPLVAMTSLYQSNDFFL